MLIFMNLSQKHRPQGSICSLPFADRVNVRNVSEYIYAKFMNLNSIDYVLIH
jgi:hypothetical protein